jgi:D-beta-D-heptose 7-phosphate kinase/D-beta-D-heptose 1-phosphate adenosyltransferase
VRRISPEAPVPVLFKESEKTMLGGAGNVARNIAALEGTAVLIGVIGKDQAGHSVHAQIALEPHIEDWVVELSGVPTTEKVRYISQQQLLRVDAERQEPIKSEAIFDAFERALFKADAVILSDYAKGLLGPDLVKHAIAAARERGVPVIVDPKAKDLSRYGGASLITPNRKEAEAATGITIEDDEAAGRAAITILEAVPNLLAVVITRSEKGMTLLKRGGAPVHLRTDAKEVFDVSGAGDTAVAVLALGLAARLDLASAVHLANTAAAIVVGKPGTATASVAELDRTLRSERIVSVEDKIATLEGALDRVATWRHRGERIGFTNGCFDLVHPGHISLLAQARANCDRLVVGLNSDESVKRLKGPGRPIQDEIAREIVLASLASVDLVVVFPQDTPLELITALRPDVLIKGKDYGIPEIVGAKEVQSWGGRIFLADLMPGQSTTKTIARMAPQ